MEIKARYVLALLLAIQLSAHLLTLNVVSFNDEGSFLTPGWLMTLGRVPYRDFYMPFYLPGAPLVSATAYTLLGPEVSSAKLFLAGFALLSTVLVFAIARSLYGEWEALAASAIFVLLAPTYSGTTFIAETLMAPFALLIFLSLLCYGRDGGRRWIFASGLLCALLVMLKPVGILLLPAAALGAYALEKQRKMTPNFGKGPLASQNDKASEANIQSRIHLNWLLAGFALPFIPLGAYLLLIGSAQGAYEQVVLCYAWFSEGDLFRPEGLLQFPEVIAIPAAFIISIRGQTEKRAESALLLILALASLYAVAVRFQPSRVYYAVPFLSIMAAAVISWNIKSRALRAGLLILLIAMSLVYPAQLLLNPVQPDPELAYIFAHTKPGDTVLALPFAPQLYVQSKREPGFRYLSLGPWGQVPETEQNAIRDIEIRRPQLILYLKSPQWGKAFSEYEPLIDKYVWEHYAVEEDFGTWLALVEKKPA